MNLKMDKVAELEAKIALLEAQKKEYQNKLNKLWEAKIKQSEEWEERLKNLAEEIKGRAPQRASGPPPTGPSLKLEDIPLGISYPVLANERAPIHLFFIRSGVI